MKYLFQFILLTIHLVAYSQRDCSGIWKLRHKTSISGPDYGNGIPDLIKISRYEDSYKLQSIYSSSGKQAVDSEVILIGDTALETITESKRKRKVRLIWDNKLETWKMQVELSAKDDFSKPEIKITQFISVAENDSELTLKKTYSGINAPDGNQDYCMNGIYEKITSEQFAIGASKDKGIKFVTGLKWQQIIELAKRENKLIFVDCYATWCLPCKKMDNDVYPLNVVGDAINGNFVSLKVQMDTNAKDNEAIKLTYPIARRFERKCNIRVLPTFLFFDSNGKIVHKGEGAQTYESFIKITQEAADSSLQIYSLIRKAQNGKLNPKQLRELTDKLNRKYADKELSKVVVRSYIDTYLNKLNSDSILTKFNLDFLYDNWSTVNSTDRIFGLFLNSPGKIDSVECTKGFASSFVETIITKEEVTKYMEAAFKDKSAPNWVQIERTITRKFGKHYANRCIVNAKVRWYRFRKAWKPYCKYLVQQVKLNELGNTSWFYLNQAAWSIFQHSNKTAQLKMALKWSEEAMKDYEGEEKKEGGQLIDTYANLLYKLGRIKEAVEYQEKAVSLIPKDIQLKETLSKMMNGIPTWSSNDSKK